MDNVIILGSGRSGTSMVANLFFEAGYYLGDNYLGEKNSNPKGFFEDYTVNTVNENIISTVVKDIPEKIRRRVYPSYTFYRARWLARLKKGLNYQLSEKDKLSIEKLLTNTPFCYKDPRFSYTLPVWLPILPKNTYYLCIFREPQNTAMSIVKECKSSEALAPLKMNFKIALDVWYKMYDNIIDIYNNFENKSQWLFLHYNQVLEGGGIEKIEKLLKLNLDKSVPEKRINRTKINADIPQKHKLLYSALCKLADYE